MVARLFQAIKDPLVIERDGKRRPVRFFHRTDVKRSLCSTERATQGTLINATSAHFAAISLGSRLHYNVTELIPASIHAVQRGFVARTSLTQRSLSSSRSKKKRKMGILAHESRFLNSHYKHRINLLGRFSLWVVPSESGGTSNTFRR